MGGDPNDPTGGFSSQGFESSNIDPNIIFQTFFGGKDPFSSFGFGGDEEGFSFGSGSGSRMGGMGGGIPGFAGFSSFGQRGQAGQQGQAGNQKFNFSFKRN